MLFKIIYLQQQSSFSLSVCSRETHDTERRYHHMLMKDVTHKVKVSVLRHLPVVREDILGLDMVAGLLLWLVVVVVLLLLGCFVRVLLVKVVHEGRTYRLLGGGVSCG